MMRYWILLFIAVLFFNCSLNYPNSAGDDNRIIILNNIVTIDTIFPGDDTIYINPDSLNFGCDCTQVFAPVDTTFSEVPSDLYDEALGAIYSRIFYYGINGLNLRDSIYGSDTIRDIDKYTVRDYRESIENLADPGMFAAVYNRGPQGILYSCDTLGRVDSIYRIYNNTPLGGLSPTPTFILRKTGIYYSVDNKITAIKESEKTILYGEDSCYVYPSSNSRLGPLKNSTFHYIEPVFAKFIKTVTYFTESADTQYENIETTIYRIHISNLAIISIVTDLTYDETTIDTLFIPEISKRSYCGDLKRHAEL